MFETVKAGRSGNYFFSLMAFLFLATAIVGFGPNSVAILTGEKANPPLIIHVHAAAMFSWLILLSTQASLIALNKKHLHRQLGIAIVLLAPSIVVLMCVLAVSGFPGFDTPRGGAIALFQVKRITLFSLFCVWGFVARKTDLQAHKRLMLLATFVVLDAAFNRMMFLPTLGFPSRTAFGLVAQLGLLLPLICFDLRTSGRLHKVTVAGISLIVPFTVAVILLM